MSNQMTRGERRGLIALLALLAVIIGVSVFERGVDAPVKIENNRLVDSVMTVSKDTLMVEKHSRKKAKNTKKAKIGRTPVPERSPLDEKIPAR